MRDDATNMKTNLSALECLLDKENVDHVKEGIANLILDRVRRDIDSYDYYLFYPEDYTETIDEAFEKVRKKITKIYSDAMLEVANEATQRFKDIALAAINEAPGFILRSCHKCTHCNFNRCEFYEQHYWEAHDEICAKEGFVNYDEKKK